MAFLEPGSSSSIGAGPGRDGRALPRLAPGGGGLGEGEAGCNAAFGLWDGFVFSLLVCREIQTYFFQQQLPWIM